MGEPWFLFDMETMNITLFALFTIGLIFIVVRAFIKYHDDGWDK